MNQGTRWILDVDLRKYFDTLDHTELRRLLDLRVKDGVIRRLIDKWLNAGVLEEGRVHYPNEGTPQGGVITLPTMLQKAPTGASHKRDRINPVDDLHSFFTHFDSLNQCSNYFSPAAPIDL